MEKRIPVILTRGSIAIAQLPNKHLQDSEIRLEERQKSDRLRLTLAAPEGTKVTLQGSPVVSKNATYCVGVLSKGKLYLIPVSSIYQFRPEYPGMDAPKQFVEDREPNSKNKLIVSNETKAKQILGQVKTAAELEAMRIQREMSQSHWYQQIEAEPWRPATYVEHSQFRDSLEQFDQAAPLQCTTTPEAYLDQLCKDDDDAELE